MVSISRRHPGISGWDQSSGVHLAPSTFWSAYWARYIHHDWIVTRTSVISHSLEVLHNGWDDHVTGDSALTRYRDTGMIYDGTMSLAEAARSDVSVCPLCLFNTSLVEGMARR